MKTIELHGILRKKFGRFFRLDVKSASEACRAIACQLPEFERFMLNSERLGYQFAIFNGKTKNKETNINESQVDDETTAKHIHIMPKVMGSGGKTMGWLQVVGGLALIGAGVMSSMNPALIGAGAGMLMGGVSSLLMPTPKIDKTDDEANRANNGFGGAVTTIAQGNPVAILYGYYEIGGFMLSAGRYSENKQWS